MTEKSAGDRPPSVRRSNFDGHLLCLLARSVRTGVCGPFFPLTIDRYRAMAAPSVSIIIVSWNAKSVVQQCLPSVVATEYPNFEIIFADNASTDGTAAWIAREYPEVKIVRHPENWLFCRGNNAALPHTTGDFVVLLNNDVEVPPRLADPTRRGGDQRPQRGRGTAQNAPV